MRTLPAFAAVAVLLLAGCTGSDDDPGAGGTTYRDPKVPAGAFRLVAFDSCDSLLSGLRGAAKAAVGPWGFGGGQEDDGMTRGGPAMDRNEAAPGGAAKAPPQPGVDYSGTNTHERGVDEPDLVKTDGRRIVAVAGGKLRVTDLGTRRITGSVSVAGGEQLLLEGDRALVLGASPGGEGVDLTLVDLAGPPTVLGAYTFEGSMVDARQVGAITRVVVRSSPRLAFPDNGRDLDGRVEVNRAAIDRAPLDTWLPRYSTVDHGGKRSAGRVDCGAVNRPAEYSGTAMLTVLTFDLTKPSLGTGEPVTVVADGDTVYSNGPSLYVANDQRWRARPIDLGNGTRLKRAPVTPRTELYKFDTAGRAKPVFEAAGAVDGWLLNQYSMSEWDGNLRIATTSAGGAGGTDSSVYVLRQQGDSLVTTGQVGGLGKGERIFSVRFVGTTGYVVTFRQTDPLYTIDLRDPRSPKVRGELKITGYSAYLHPAGDGRLIGVGQEASERGMTMGTQVSLFDVGDLTAPRRLAQYHLRGASSEAEFDPHAFLYWPATGLLAIPTIGRTTSLLVLSVRDSSITELGTLTQPGSATIQRSMVIGQALWTYSDRGLAANDLGSLSSTAWVPFN